MKKLKEHNAILLLLFLLSTDLTFTGLHITEHIVVSNSSPWEIRITEYLFIYHLIKLFLIILLFMYLLKLTRYSGYISWIMVFTYFLIDDAFLLHQKIGDRIANNYISHLPTSLGFHPRFFELAVLSIVGIILLIVLAWAYFVSPINFRKMSNDMLLFFVALVFFGVIVDIAAAIKLGPGVLLVLDIIEDGGEMVVFSLILWYVFLLAIRKGRPNLLLLDLLGESQN